MFSFRRLYLLGLPLLTFVFAPGYVFGQSEPNEISQVLGEEILAPSVAVHQVKSYILSRVAPPPSATNAQQWTEQAKRLRQHLLQDVVFHGWPDEWVNASPKFEDLGVIETGQGYRLRKLRYEIVPGFQSVAILYEPEKLQGKVPAILNVNGHVGPPGKPVEYKQRSHQGKGGYNGFHGKGRDSRFGQRSRQRLRFPAGSCPRGRRSCY